jgi:hypothetical protein
MPRYFFSIEGVSNLSQDMSSDEHPNDHAARAAAVLWLREIASEGLKENWDMTHWRVVVSSECGRTISEIAIKE